tara:strand:+ start:831 stop:1133 length:303 start_codon:yes stop_codon:yes gene_type:complete
MKKGKMTEAEYACIRGMIANDIEVGVMAKQLDRSVDAVQKAVDSIEAEIARDKLIINKSAKGQKGLAVMTQEASERDDARRPHRSANTPSRIKKSIHTIR